jgi:hypothetical protein
MAVDIDLKKYQHENPGAAPDTRATITVHATGDDQHPSLDFQSSGSFFEDRDGDTWRILRATVVEDSTTRYDDDDKRQTVQFYSWRYEAELVTGTDKR